MSSALPLNPRFHGRVLHADKRRCARPGCAELGEFKAPDGFEPHVGDTPPVYQWLCLEHVRQFNAGYDVFKAMTPEQRLEAQANGGHPSWNKKIWPFASQGGGFGRASDLHLHDPMEMFAAKPGFKTYAERVQLRDGKPLTAADSAALKLLSLEPDVTLRQLKARYKVLVRQFHPDSNGGDRTHEAQLRKVIDAYTRLLKSPAFRAPTKS
jgi:DnaJ domain